MNNGWVKLWRKIRKTSFYKKPLTCHLAQHLVMSANTEDKETIFNSQQILVKRGQCIVGRKKLSEETGLSERASRTAIRTLTRCNFLTSKTTNRYTLITILKYDQYQEKRPAERPAELQKTTSRTTSKTTTSKEEEEEEEDNTPVKKEKYEMFTEVWEKIYKKKLRANIVDEMAIKRLTDSYGIENVCGLLVWAEKNRSINQYIAVINRPRDLEEKWNSLNHQYLKRERSPFESEDVGIIKNATGKIISKE